MEDRTGKLVTALATIQLDEDAAAVGFVVDVGQQVERLDDPSQSLQCQRQLVRPIVRLQSPHQPASLDKAQVGRSGKARQVNPMLDDQVDVHRMRG